MEPFCCLFSLARGLSAPTPDVGAQGARRARAACTREGFPRIRDVSLRSSEDRTLYELQPLVEWPNYCAVP